MAGIKVVVIGAGIAGLTVAASLARAGVAGTVYDQVDRFAELGAGIQLSPNATRLVHRLGLADQLDAVAVRPAAIELRRWDNNDVIGRTELGAACEARYGAPYYTLHRGDLHAILLDLVVNACGSSAVRLDHRCVGLDESAGGVELRFANGCRAAADVVVGADGIHSVVRKALVRDDARFSGLVVHRGLVRTSRLAHLGGEPKVLVWLGPRQHFVCYPISGGRWLNFVAATPADDWSTESWTAPGQLADLVCAYAGWHDDVLSVLASADSVTRWALHDRAPLGRWCTRRVTVVGDAAHPMLPFAAQGANQAIEAAVALAACLCQGGAGDVSAALRRYEQVRVPRLARVSAAVREHTRSHHLADGPAQQERDRAIGAHASLRGQVWLYGYDAEWAALAAGAPSAQRLARR